MYIENIQKTPSDPFPNRIWIKNISKNTRHFRYSDHDRAITRNRISRAPTFEYNGARIESDNSKAEIELSRGANGVSSGNLAVRAAQKWDKWLNARVFTIWPATTRCKTAVFCWTHPVSFAGRLYDCTMVVLWCVCNARWLWFLRKMWDYEKTSWEKCVLFWSRRRMIHM